MWFDGSASFYGFRHGFEDQRFFQDGFEEVLCGCQASCDFSRVHQSRDTQKYGIVGFFTAKAHCTFEA